MKTTKKSRAKPQEEIEIPRNCMECIYAVIIPPAIEGDPPISRCKRDNIRRTARAVRNCQKGEKHQTAERGM